MLQLQHMHPTHLEKIEKYSPLSELNTQRFRCAEFESIDWKTSYAMIGCSHLFGEANEIQDSIPYILTQLTDIYCANLGANGSSREVIFFNAMNVLQQTTVKKVIVIWTYPKRINVYTDDGYNTANKIIEQKATSIKQRSKLEDLQNRVIDTLYNSTHFSLITAQYIDILTRAFADRIIILDIRDLEQEFGGHVNPAIKFDVAKDNKHYGPIWNRKVANKIKNIINDSN